MRISQDDDDLVWRALANPLRRAILDVLRAGPRTTGELVEALESDRHVVMQHLGVLREADLVLVEPKGRSRVNHLNPVPIQRIHRRWVAEFEQPWAAALVGLKDTLERAEPDEQEGHDVG
ncbi:ArsR/SmtB family transcription factor [Umezawaea endophytica]|uniref:Metalloregulator ArsR/SmtB family transcription factor n=1 Tax=Umezawaea endophytica TaxID=1654476 RepID=A0A9X2VH83_9PSEU|nr:metalloregulator ArsR/SmtB family transcription factor [Umezawaea endophytica]MCS7476598.1 metalloregulator ArsR/SmtB family transcription factor [Umezawaea endophytica]